VSINLYSYTEGTEKTFNDATAPGHVLLTATLTVRIDMNVTDYAAQYGSTTEYELDRDPIDTVVQHIMECIPEHLRSSILIGTTNPDIDTPRTIVSEDK
jgi:hypothetical protein